MALTDIDVCNEALTLMGASPIAGFVEDTDNAAICNRLYVTTRRSLLARYPWRFATKKRQLDQQVTPPENEWTYQYLQPSDSLGVIDAVFSSGDANAVPVTEYEIYEDKVFSDHPEVYVDYRIDVTEAKWPAYFLALMVQAFASKICYPITGNQSLAAGFRENAYGTGGEAGTGGLFREAKQQDSRQSPPRSMLHNGGALIEARFGGAPRRR